MIYHFEKKYYDNYNFCYVTRYGIRIPYKIEIHDIPNTTTIGECLDILKNEKSFRYKDSRNKVNYMKINCTQFLGEIDENEFS